MEILLYIAYFGIGLLASWVSAGFEYGHNLTKYSAIDPRPSYLFNIVFYPVWPFALLATILVYGVRFASPLKTPSEHGYPTKEFG